MCLSVFGALCGAVFCAGYFSQVVFQDIVCGVTCLYLVHISVFLCASSANLMRM